jgi:cyclophilin family peptidyl-prolyl cis-trans isomerase
MRVFVLTILGFLLAGAGTAQAQDATPAKPAPRKWVDVAVVPPLTPENTLNLQLSTGGPVVIQLRPEVAPHSVERIKTLASQGFYNGLIFHRVIDGFMAQTGDPKGTGEGGSALPDVNAEFNDLPHLRGTISLARAEGENSANSQFFIMLAPNLKLDHRYSAFGRVVSGMAFVDAIERGEPPANPSKIVRAWIGLPDGTVATPAAAANAAAAASEAATQQSSQAALASDEAARAALAGDDVTARERATAAGVAATTAAQASADANEAARAAGAN